MPQNMQQGRTCRGNTPVPYLRGTQGASNLGGFAITSSHSCYCGAPTSSLDRRFRTKYGWVSRLMKSRRSAPVNTQTPIRGTKTLRQPKACASAPPIGGLMTCGQRSPDVQPAEVAWQGQLQVTPCTKPLLLMLHNSNDS